MKKEVNETRLANAAQKLLDYQGIGDYKLWKYVWDNLVEFEWHNEKIIRQAIVSAPAKWLRSIGIEAPEDVLAMLSATDIEMLELTYKDGTRRLITRDELGLLALVVEQLRLWPGAELTETAKAYAEKKWPKTPIEPVENNC